MITQAATVVCQRLKADTADNPLLPYEQGALALVRSRLEEATWMLAEPDSRLLVLPCSTAVVPP
jgi:hypothetical protein